MVQYLSWASRWSTPLKLSKRVPGCIKPSSRCSFIFIIRKQCSFKLLPSVFVCAVYKCHPHRVNSHCNPKHPPPPHHTEHYCFLKLSHEGLEQLSTPCVGIKERRLKETFREVQQRMSYVLSESLRIFLLSSLNHFICHQRIWRACYLILPPIVPLSVASSKSPS